jgi:hypothetical protein
MTRRGEAMCRAFKETQSTFSRYAIAAVTAFLLVGCPGRTAVQLRDFAAGLDASLSKMDFFTVYQLLDDAPESKRRVEEHVHWKQCDQKTNDPMILLGSREPVSMTVEAAVDNNAGLVLLQPNNTFGFIFKGGSSASWKLLPISLSDVPDTVFEKKMTSIEKLSDKDKTNEYMVASDERQKLGMAVGALISAYPSKADCYQYCIAKVERAKTKCAAMSFRGGCPAPSSVTQNECDDRFQGAKH